MQFSGLEIREEKVLDILTTLGFVFVALVIPGYIQLHYGVSALKLTIMITLFYLAIHLILEHRKWHFS